MLRGRKFLSRRVLCITFSYKVSSDQAGHFVICLLGLNSAVNHLVYAILKRDIKMVIIKLICKETKACGI
jgi:hypothetical protein